MSIDPPKRKFSRQPDFSDDELELINVRPIPVESTSNRKPKKSAESIRKRSIYFKSMAPMLPYLQFIPGECHQITNTQQTILSRFIHEVHDKKLVSLMLFIDNNDKLKVIALSTDLITIYFKTTINPVVIEPLLILFNDANIKFILPSINNWLPRNDLNLYMLFRNLYPNLPPEPLNYVVIDSYMNSLHINNNGKDICQHIMLLNWIFQLRITNFLHGNPVLQYLPPQYEEMVHKYTKILVYLYWALEMKQKIFDQNPIAVDLSPIYIHNVIFEHGLMDVTPQNMQCFIGNDNYPDPPLPVDNSKPLTPPNSVSS